MGEHQEAVIQNPRQSDHPWSKLEIPAQIHLGDCPMGVHLTRGKPCPRCNAQPGEGCLPYPTALEAALLAARADRDRFAARVEELEAALRPFAEASTGIPAGVIDAAPACHVNADARHPGTITTILTGAYRAAARALQPDEARS